MASERFPVLEVLDGLRQLVYVPEPFTGDDGNTVDVWNDLARANPLWQLVKRRQFTLNRAVVRSGQTVPVDSDRPDGPIQRIPYPDQPYDPPTSFTDQFLLPRPQLFDSLREIGIQASSVNEGITGVAIEWANDAFSYDGQADFAYRAILFVANQPNPSQRALRYMNWFNHVLRATEFVTEGVLGVFLKQPPLAIQRIIDTMDRTPVFRPEITVEATDRIERFDALQINLTVSMDYLEESDSRVSSSDDTLFLRR